MQHILPLLKTAVNALHLLLVFFIFTRLISDSAWCFTCWLACRTAFCTTDRFNFLGFIINLSYMFHNFTSVTIEY